MRLLSRMHAALFRQTLPRRVLHLTLLGTLALSQVAHAQLSEQQIGSWLLSPHEGIGPSLCILTTFADEGNLQAFVNENNETQFGFSLSSSKDLNLRQEGVSFWIDGKAAPVSAVHFIDEKAVHFEQPDGAPPLDELVEQARVVEIRGRSFVAAFEMQRTLEAINILYQCYDPARIHNGTAEAAEQQKAVAQHGIQSSPAGSGLDAAIDSMAATVPMAAQFVCEVGSSAMMGIPDISGRDQMNELTVSVAQDGTATINGTSVPAASQRNAPDGSLSLVAYEAKAVIAALQGAVGSAPPVLGLSPQQLEAYQAFQGIGRQMTGMVMGNRARFMLVNLAQDAITFFDVEADDRPTNQQSPFCIRTQ